MARHAPPYPPSSPMIKIGSANPQPDGSPRIRLGISACLLGARVRYDGNHKNNPLLSGMLAGHVCFVPICPEVGCGLGVPRTPMRLEDTIQNPRLRTAPSEHTITPVDHTHRLRQWSQQHIHKLKTEDLGGFLFKSRSPSCGLTRVHVFTKQAGDKQPQGHPLGVGIFAQMLRIACPDLPMAEGDLLQNKKAVRAFLQTMKNRLKTSG